MKTTSHFPASIWRTAIAALCLGPRALGAVAAAPSAEPAPRIRNIVLVHGAWADGSGWEPVYELLTAKGYQVSVVQNPLTSFAADVAATKAVLDAQTGPVVLVGHSYGGAVITEAGNDAKVERLVYIAAFAPDQGESVQSLIANPPPEAPAPPILPPVNGFLWLDPDKFAAAFAADVAPDRARFLAHAQVPWSVEALGGKVAAAAWKAKPSWYLVSTDDRMIPPVAQRTMSRRIGATVMEAKASHAVYVSRPKVVADLIEWAATGRK